LVTQVTTGAVRAWKAGSIRQDHYDRFTALRTLVFLLSDSLSPRGVGQWLHARNRLLDGERPINLCARVSRSGWSRQRKLSLRVPTCDPSDACCCSYGGSTTLPVRRSCPTAASTVSPPRISTRILVDKHLADLAAEHRELGYQATSSHPFPGSIIRAFIVA
jgi:hypothetical protein